MDNMYEKLMKSLAVWFFVMFFFDVSSSILFFVYAIAFRSEIFTFLSLLSVKFLYFLLSVLLSDQNTAA